MTNQTIKEISLVVTMFGAIIGAPQFYKAPSDQIMTDMHLELSDLSKKVDGLRSSDSSMLINYLHVSQSVDSLVIRARVEDGIRKALGSTLNRPNRSRGYYASKEDNQEDATQRSNEKRYKDLLESLQ